MRRRGWAAIALLVFLGLFGGSFGWTGGFGLLETPGNTVNVTVHQPVAQVPLPTVSPTPTPVAIKIPCPGNRPGKVIFYANDPAAARYHDFGTPLLPGLSPLYEPPSTPRPATLSLVNVTWIRLCHDPALTRDVTAAAYPTWPGLHGPFHWLAALRLLARGHWSTASVAYYAAPPTPDTMMMVSTSKRGPPLTYIVHAPFQGWYLVVRFGAHNVLLRPGCGDQPVLKLHGYQAPLTSLFHRA